MKSACKLPNSDTEYSASEVCHGQLLLTWECLDGVMISSYSYKKYDNAEMLEQRRANLVVDDSRYVQASTSSNCHLRHLPRKPAKIRQHLAHRLATLPSSVKGIIHSHQDWQGLLACQQIVETKVSMSIVSYYGQLEAFQPLEW